MMKKSRKGFTIVELVIVIAVIAVLAAVLIPTFIHLVNKANKASDQSLVTNLNKALAMREAELGDTENHTMHDAVLDLEEEGFKLSQLVAKSDEDILWNSKTNRFFLTNEFDDVKSQTEGGLEKVDCWKVEQAMPSAQEWSIYAGHSWSGNPSDLTVGFDAGSRTTITAVKYVGEKDVVLRGNGDSTVLTIDAPQANVDFYGFAKEVNVTAVKGESLHIYGAAAKLSVTAGHVVVEDTGIVFDLAANTGSVANNGYIAQQTSGTAPTGTSVGGNLQINSLARLEAFRDTVNAGQSFAGRTIELTANITLKDGWRPIGEGTRKVAAEGLYAGMQFSGTAFAGEFNGNGKTISNLNNKGFVPTSNRVASNQYAYGLFAVTTNGANIHDLVLSNVDIDTSRYGDAAGDSVGALIGFSAGSLTINNVEVKDGKIKGVDGVASIVGRAYNQSGDSVITVSIQNCKSNATISCVEVSDGSKAAGIAGFVQLRKDGNTNVGCPLTIKGCSFNGTASNAVYTHELYTRGSIVELSADSQAGLLVK